jgi:hypothetical protein
MAVAQRSQSGSQARTLAALQDQVQAEAQWKTADEARLMPPAPIRTNKKYLFRFKPGTGHLNLSIKIPHLPDSFESDRHEKVLTRKFEQNRARVDGDEPKYDLTELQDELGTDWITFTPMPGNRNRGSTSYYATDSDQIAAFIRKQVREGRDFWKDVVEERPAEMIEVNGTTIPNTTEGWDAAKLAALTRARSIDEE